MELFASANGLINHIGHCMCHIVEQQILFISTSHKIPPTPTPHSHRPHFLFHSRNISRQSCKTMTHNYPEQKSTVALTNVVFTVQATLCSHISTNYLLFISAKEREGKKVKGKGRQGKRKSEWSRQTERGGTKPWATRHSETFHDNRAEGFRNISY